MQDNAVLWRKLLPAMAPRGILTVYFNPERDGDLKARLKAVGEAQSGAYGRVTESDVGRRLLLERLAELEGELDLKSRQAPRPPRSGRKPRAV